MQIKKIMKTVLSMSAGAVLGIALYIGVLTVLANYPEAPEGEHTGGWLGEVFHLNGSNADLLAVRSRKVLIPTEIADVNLNKQVPTKEYVDDYVDKKVNAAGGGTVVINGSTMPTMISNLRNGNSSQGGAAQYCNGLAEGGYDDWRLPTFDELSYAVSTLKDTSGQIPRDGYLWTRTRADYSVTGGSTNSYWLVLHPVNGSWGYNTNINNYARCVR